MVYGTTTEGYQTLPFMQASRGQQIRRMGCFGKSYKTYLLWAAVDVVLADGDDTQGTARAASLTHQPCHSLAEPRRGPAGLQCMQWVVVAKSGKRKCASPTWTRCMLCPYWSVLCNLPSRAVMKRK